MVDLSDDKTEEPTQHKLKEARKKGQVAKSQDLTAVAVLVAVYMFFSYQTKKLFIEMGKIMTYQLEHFTSAKLDVESFNQMLYGTVVPILVAFIPLFVLMILVGTGVSLLQTNFMLSFQAIKPKMEKINPIENAKQKFSMKGLVEVIKTVFKFGVLILLFHLFLKDNLNAIMTTIFLPTRSILTTLIEMTLSVTYRAVGALFILAGLDYGYQYYNFMKEMRMTKQEIKEEYKSTEGDPHIKSRRKSQAMAFLRKLMMQNVPKSRVVITNPTHYAVALKYDEEKDSAPSVSAKGVDYMALQVRKIAEENDVPIVENPPLARNLYDNVEIDETIPEDMYRAVAEIIAYLEVLEMKKAKGKKIEW